MKRTHKMLLFFCLLLSSILTAQNQSICLDYDAAGNRIKRWVCASAKETTVREETAVVPVAVKTIRINPSPSTGIIQLHSTGFAPETEVYIFDLQGVMILKSTLATQQFDLSDQPDGVYFLQIKDSETQTSSFIIHH